MTQTRSTSIFDLSVGDVVVPHTAEYQEWQVAGIERLGFKWPTFKITWGNGDTTHHDGKARFSVKTR